jgi:hypothetical protein
MNFKAHVKPLGTALLLIIICIPMAFIVTVLSNPFWLWIESTFSFESAGHSGPAEWCYIVVYISLVAASWLIWLYIKNRHMA